MEKKIMRILIINKDNKKNGRNWLFESDMGCILTFDMLSKHIGETPEHRFDKSEKLIMVLVTNRQLDNALKSLKEEDLLFPLLSFHPNPYLDDIRLLRYGKTTMC